MAIKFSNYYGKTQLIIAIALFKKFVSSKWIAFIKIIGTTVHLENLINWEIYTSCDVARGTSPSTCG
jgi:hypothetical protein